MTKELLKLLNGNRNGGFRKLIDKLPDNPRIAWYPSAGEDFSPLLYLHPGFEEIFPPNEGSSTHPPPDLFLFTDYFPWTNSTFLDTEKIFSDDQTYIRLIKLEELPLLHSESNNALVDLPDGSVATGRVLFVEVEVDSTRLGRFTSKVLYVYSVNEHFCSEMLIPNEVNISHIIHIRYGGGLGGGGKASGVWLNNVIGKPGCELLITDNHYFWQKGDRFAVGRYPVLRRSGPDPDLHLIRVTP